MIITIRTQKSLGEVRQALEDSVSENRWTLLGMHDVGERLRAKGLVFERKLYVYELCNPSVAKQVLDADVQIGTALPCRVSVYTDRGGVVLETIRPTALLALFNRPELADLAKETEKTIRKIMEQAAE
jgi:uncharacterized protein (DUF302 family)